MEITEAELTYLIIASSRDNLVQGSFGGNHLSLEDTPDNQWAIQRVKEMRAAKPKTGETT